MNRPNPASGYHCASGWELCAVFVGFGALPSASCSALTVAASVDLSGAGASAARADGTAAAIATARARARAEWGGRNFINDFVASGVRQVSGLVQGRAIKKVSRAV